MCGIAGGIGVNPPDKKLLTEQLKTLEHRGPDDEGMYLSSGISLGMRRLAIVEIENGQQPYVDMQNKICVVFNGEIYNYRELRLELEQKGIGFHSTSEAEVIARLYLEYGISSIAKLNGMFAIAISDERVKTLHLARDRMGKKPLWYSRTTDGTLYFASEVKSLLVVRRDRTLRPSMISEVMQYGFVNSPNSAFNEISEVPPASILTWSSENIEINSYWVPKFEESSTITYKEALETTEQLISNAVSRRLISERPMGSFLSGGIDSTVVTAFMVKLQSNPVHTYSIGFKSKEFNELSHARRIAAFLGTVHHEEIIDPDPSFLVNSLAATLDQPFADSSVLPTFLLAKFASRDIVVALGGDGGDEVFGGYDRYLAAPILQGINPLLPAIRTTMPLVKLFLGQNQRKFNRIKSQLHIERTLAYRYSSILSLNNTKDLSMVLNPDLLQTFPEDNFLKRFNEGSLSAFNRMTRSDLTFYLPDDLLFKSDIASMANSLELRSPLLDWEVVEWGLSLPKEFKIKHGERKHILKDIARSLAPPELINRPKMGFAIPRAEWLRTGLKALTIETLTDKTATDRGWFNEKVIKKFINEHMQGLDRDQQLWPALMLELWARNWLD